MNDDERVKLVVEVILTLVVLGRELRELRKELRRKAKGSRNRRKPRKRKR